MRVQQVAERKRMGLDAELTMKKNVEQKEVVDIIEVKYLNMNESLYIRYTIFLFCVSV